MTDRRKRMTDSEPGAPRTPMNEQALEERRTVMQSAEGHAGSIPRGNPQPEDENVGQHRDEYERVLGH